MAAAKRLDVILLAAFISCMFTACAADKPSDDAAVFGNPRLLLGCMNQLNRSVFGTLRNPPQFLDIKDSVSWTRQHLPSDIQDALAKAGQSAIKAAEPGSLATLATSSDQFNKVLDQATDEELSKIPEYQADGCGQVVPLQMLTVLETDLNISEGSLKKSFGAMGLTDHNAIEHAYLRMLTLDASGSQWDEAWLAKH